MGPFMEPIKIVHELRKIWGTESQKLGLICSGTANIVYR